LSAWIAVPAALLGAEPQAEVRFSTDAYGPAWVGEEVRLNLELWSDGFSFGKQLFQLPEVEGGFLLQPDASTVKLTERRGGATWQGLRYRLLLYPQRGGRLEVPAFDVSFEASSGFGQPAAPFTFSTEPLSVEARLPPGVQPGQLLVTSSAFELDASWTPAPTAGEPLELTVGDALTLQVLRSADRVPGMVFPPIPIFEIDGLAAYPDKSRVTDRSDRGLLRGQREDSITYLCEREGQYELPAIRFRWWDPQREALEERVIEAVSLAVMPNPALAAETAPHASDQGSALPLRIGTVAAAVLLAAVLLWYPGRWIWPRLSARWRQWREEVEAGEPWAFRRLRSACRGGDPAAAYRAVSAWLRRTGGAAGPRTLLELAAVHGDDALAQQARDLQARLLDNSGSPWDGGPLLQALERARERLTRAAASRGSLAPLNPAGR
jgi:hypothetical protein